jgi:protoporphyrinogen oxidase
MNKNLEKNNFDYIVVGGGMAGLSFSYEMKKKGYNILIIEKDSQVGGLSKTLLYKNFSFDYCAHRFHSGNEEVMNKVKKIMVNNFFLHNQKSRIFMFNKFLKYPFQLQNFFRAAPIHQSFAAALNFFYSS